MIYDDLIRQFLLSATALVFLFFCLWALIKPTLLASMLGYELKTPNSISEFHAIYVGVFAAQALLCCLAVTRVEDAIVGDLVAVFLLAQPLARLVAFFRKGIPIGFLRVLFILEIIAGLALLMVRPSL